jgi:uncharacterized protein
MCREWPVSTDSNRKLIEKIFSRLAEGDGSLFVEALSDDVVMRVTGLYTWSKSFRGQRTLLRDLYGHLGTLTTGPSKTIAHNIIADGDHVVVEARGEMTTKDGRPYNNEYCLVYRLQDGKITEIREYQDSTLCEAVLGKFPTEGTGA